MMINCVFLNYIYTLIYSSLKETDARSGRLVCHVMMCCCVLQLLANIVIYFCAITVGVMSYYMADRKHRKAFLEARQSLEVKLNMEEQSQQQVRDTTRPNQHQRVEFNAGQSAPSLEMQGLETRFLKVGHLT